MFSKREYIKRYNHPQDNGPRSNIQNRIYKEWKNKFDKKKIQLSNTNKISVFIPRIIGISANHIFSRQNVFHVLVCVSVPWHTVYPWQATEQSPHHQLQPACSHSSTERQKKTDYQHTRCCSKGQVPDAISKLLA